ncbi:MAG: long-chain fatty acid--CoA ligase [Planctomycetota bacterium]|nr:MAG: long-chain fatty acid--CoA ligase [Planctomycetota bacterium]
MATVPATRPWFRFWPEGVPRSIDYPRVSLVGLLSQAAERFRGKLFLRSEHVEYSFSQVEELSTRLASSLVKLGIKKGDRVMLFMPNIAEFAVCFYAVLKAGGIVTAANPLFKESELEYQITDSGAAAFIVHQDQLGTAQKVMHLFDEKKVVVVGDSDHDFACFSELIRSAPRTEFPDIDSARDVAVLQYTGGTTGMPKGAMITHFNLVANAVQNAEWFSWKPDDAVMGTLPLYHTWGCNACLNSPLYVGCPVTLVEKFDPARVLRTVERDGATIWYGAATMFNILLQEPEIEKSNLSSLRCVKAGAMPVPEEIRMQWNEVTGIPLLLGYGLSEASPETHDSPPNRVKANTIGIPLIDTDARIVDIETGKRELPSGETGELVIKGPQVMKGYWKEEPEDDISGVRNGWLYTGDIAEMDGEGYFYIRDRKKDLIKYKGYSVAPAEVEGVLFEHPAVLEAAVVGKADPVFGEVPKAFVVCMPGRSVTEKELIDFCTERIAPYKKIREIEFVEEIPKNAVGKVLRRLLRDKG